MKNVVTVGRTHDLYIVSHYFREFLCTPCMGEKILEKPKISFGDASLNAPQIKFQVILETHLRKYLIYT